MGYPHFEGLDPLHHVKKKREETLSLRYEPHGTEISGSMASFAEVVRESAMFFLLVLTLLHNLSPHHLLLFYCLILAISWTIWKAGKSAWLGWFRLERFHRVIEQEKYEIENHRPQEREELYALYSAKGLEGELLDQVVDGLMADQDHLLKVMLEEELGLVLEGYEHPLKQALGAMVGSLLSSFFILLSFFFISFSASVVVAFALLGLSAAFSAKKEGNRMLPAFIWSMAIGALAFGSLTFLLDWLARL